MVVQEIFISENQMGFYPVLQLSNVAFLSHEEDIAKFLNISIEEFENKQLEFGAYKADATHGVYFKEENDCQKFIDQYLQSQVDNEAKHSQTISRLKKTPFTKS